MRPPAGDLDRRITIELASFVKDDAGDPIPTWSVAFKLYAKRIIKSGISQPGSETPTPQVVLRQADVNWEVRFGPKAQSIAPETHRVVWKGRVYEILGILEGTGRGDRIQLSCATRPDLRGSMAPEGSSG